MKAVYRGKVTVTDGQGSEWRHDVGGIEPKAMGIDNRGKKVMVKSPHSVNHVYAEYLCYALAKKLGFKVNEVRISENGIKFGFEREFCSIHTWEESFIPKYQFGGGNGSRKVRRKVRDQELALGLFDMIINNCDRHEGNYGYITLKGTELFLIDHGHCEPWGDRCDRQIDMRWNLEAAIHLDNRHPVVKLMNNLLALTEQDLDDMTKEIHGFAEGIRRFKDNIRKWQDAIRQERKPGEAIQCQHCGEIHKKSDNQFSKAKDSVTGYDGWCKACRNEYNRRRKNQF